MPKMTHTQENPYITRSKEQAKNGKKKKGRQEMVLLIIY